MSARMRYRIKGTGLYVQPVASAAYEGASQSTRMARWRPSSGGPNTVLGGSLPTLRSRSREKRRNEGLADRAIESWVTNVIGTGIQPQFKTRDKDFNQQLQADFLAWTDEADADGKFDYYGLQALAVSGMAEGGDVFTRLRFRLPSDGLTVPLQLQVLESEYCPDEKTELVAGGNVIRQGVEFDRIGRRVAFWLYRSHPYDYDAARLGDGLPARVPAAEVVHLAEHSRRPGMVRGEPRLSRTLVRLHELDQFTDATLVRQKLANLFAGYEQDIAGDAEGDADSLFGGVVDSTGTEIAALEPGSFFRLPPGKTVKFSQPPEAGNTYAPFVLHEERRVAAAAGVLYEQMTGDYSQGNDRTWRAAVSEFRRACERFQHQSVVFQWCRPVVQRWAEFYVLAGKPVPKGIGAAEIGRCDHVPQGWDYINPLQDIAAQRAEVRSGFTSRSRIAARRGENIETIDAELAADNARADALGLTLDADPRKVSQAGLTQARPAGSEIPGDGAGDSGQGSGG